MKNYIIIIVSLFLVQNVKSQQEYSFTHYFEANPFFNPGASGSEDGHTFMGVFRKQWLGVDGSPTTGGLIYDHRLDKYNMGIGGNVFADKIGEMNLTTVNVNYAYRLKLNNNLTLGMGVNAGADFVTTDYDRLVYWDQQDPNIEGGKVNSVLPKAGLGFNLQHDKFYVGISIPRLLNFNSPDFHSINAPNLPMLTSHYYLTAGYEFDLKNDFTLNANTLIKYTRNVIPQGDINLTGYYKKMVGLGFGYKSLGFFSSYVQYCYDNAVTIGYAFDLSLNPMNQYSRGGTHELMVKYTLKPRTSNTRIK